MSVKIYGLHGGTDRVRRMLQVKLLVAWQTNNHHVQLMFFIDFDGESPRSKFKQEHSQTDGRKKPKNIWWRRRRVLRHWCQTSRIRGCGMVLKSAGHITTDRLRIESGWSWTFWIARVTLNDGEVVPLTPQRLHKPFFRCPFGRIAFQPWTFIIGFYGKRKKVIIQRGCDFGGQFSFNHLRIGPISELWNYELCNENVKMSLCVISSTCPAGVHHHFSWETPHFSTTRIEKKWQPPKFNLKDKLDWWSQFCIHNIMRVSFTCTAIYISTYKRYKTSCSYFMY